MNKKEKQYDDDDGRVIINMDVDGMPWHDRRIRREKVVAKKHDQGLQLSRSAIWLHTWYSVLSALLIASVFSATWILFTLFCTNIWFK